jgi:hypothetical protein
MCFIDFEYGFGSDFAATLVEVEEEGVAERLGSSVF